MANWLDIKREYEIMIEKSGVKNPEFIKTLLNVARRVNTCRNMIYAGYSWEYMCYSKPYNEASEMLELFNGNGSRYNKRESKLWNDWDQFCKANDWVNDANLGDWLA